MDFYKLLVYDGELVPSLLSRCCMEILYSSVHGKGNENYIMVSLF